MHVLPTGLATATAPTNDRAQGSNSVMHEEPPLTLAAAFDASPSGTKGKGGKLNNRTPLGFLTYFPTLLSNIAGLIPTLAAVEDGLHGVWDAYGMLVGGRSNG